MASLRPTPEFAKVSLDVAEVREGARYGRIYFNRYSDPLGYGKAPSRFSDPRRRIVSSRFGVLYLGETLRVCFLEAVLRDSRNGVVGDYPIEEHELAIRRYATVEVSARLRLVDMRGDALVRMGIPTDVARAARQGLSRAWSLALYEHPAAPDGIIYSSRLNAQTNLAIYDRSVRKLRVVSTGSLLSAPELPVILDELRVALVGDPST